jgi:hypothetical protein
LALRLDGCPVDWQGPWEAPLTVLLAGVGGISGLAFSLMYKRYIGVLGAGGGRKGYPARDAYEGLRASLSGGNLASRLYADWLSSFLDAVDCYFGDASMADRTLFPHAFGLKTPAPLWTLPAFDRCLLLALIYPTLIIFSIWAISGHVGPAETAFGFKPDASTWQRAAFAAATALTIVLLWRTKTAGALWKRCVWFILAAGAGYIAAITIEGAVTGAVTSAVVGAAYVTAVALTSRRGANTLAASLAVPTVIVGTGADRPLGANAAFFIGVGIAIFAMGPLEDIAKRYSWHGLFHAVFVLGGTPFCIYAAKFLSPFESWRPGGALLLFIGLLTFINAPFDWASLGLTRALLRRGLELGGWWPYLLALADALAAAVIIALLAIAMVVGVQTFDHLAEHSGGVDARVLPLDKLFDGIAAQPSAPEYWWVYALLLSTMIPSLLNLMIGGASLLRGIPGLPALLLRFMPPGKAVPAFDRTWLALVLTCQVFVGAFLGIAAQFVLAVGVIFYVLPWMGLELLDTARAVAEFDLPMRVLGLWWGDPR